MGRCFKLAGVMIAILAAVAVGAQSPGQTTAGNEVVGFYRIVQTTDLGTTVRATLQIHLVNNNQPELSVTKVALRSRMPASRPAETAVWARLAAREGTNVTQEIIVTRAEYESWSKGASPALQVTMQTSEGREMRRMIALRRLPARRPK
jgi:hypothetical protein